MIVDDLVDQSPNKNLRAYPDIHLGNQMTPLLAANSVLAIGYITGITTYIDVAPVVLGIGFVLAYLYVDLLHILATALSNLWVRYSNDM